MPSAGHLPWAIVLANIVGAFLLGLLYAALATMHRRGARRRRRLRLLLGTGFCGGFTTYSTLALGVVLLAGSGGAVLGRRLRPGHRFAWCTGHLGRDGRGHQGRPRRPFSAPLTGGGRP